MTPEAARQIEDTRILGKINLAHREAFKIKWPGQVEHILRLTAERLQQGLAKSAAEPLTNQEVYELSQALYSVYQIHRMIQDAG